MQVNVGSKVGSGWLIGISTVRVEGDTRSETSIFQLFCGDWVEKRKRFRSYASKAKATTRLSTDLRP